MGKYRLETVSGSLVWDEAPSEREGACHIISWRTVGLIAGGRFVEIQLWVTRHEATTPA